MKKYLIWAFGFLLWALAAGVFFREFTKGYGLANQFEVLGLVHPHVLILGVVFPIIIGLVNTKLNVGKEKLDVIAFYTYVGGVIGASIMLFVRGILNVLEHANSVDFVTSSGINGMISGLSGTCHVILAVALVFMFARWIWNKKLPKNKTEEYTAKTI